MSAARSILVWSAPCTPMTRRPERSWRDSERLDRPLSIGDARLFTFHPIENGNAEPFALRPADIHAQQHLRPVLRLSAAGPGMNCQNGVAPIVGTAKHRLQLEVLERVLHSGDVPVEFRDESSSGCGQHLGQTGGIVQSAGQGLIGSNPCLQGLDLLDLLAGTIAVRPKRGVRLQRFQGAELYLLASDVKEYRSSTNRCLSPATRSAASAIASDLYWAKYRGGRSPIRPLAATNGPDCPKT